MELAALNLNPRTQRRKRRRARPTASERSFSYSLRFPGQYDDTESGLSYNDLRAGYDSVTGRPVPILFSPVSLQVEHVAIAIQSC